MRLIATSSLAVLAPQAGGLGVLGAGTHLSFFYPLLSDTAMAPQAPPIPGTSAGILPIGVWFICLGSRPPNRHLRYPIRTPKASNSRAVRASRAQRPYCLDRRDQESQRRQNENMDPSQHRRHGSRRCEKLQT